MKSAKNTHRLIVRAFIFVYINNWHKLVNIQTNCKQLSIVVDYPLTHG